MKKLLNDEDRGVELKDSTDFWEFDIQMYLNKNNSNSKYNRSSSINSLLESVLNNSFWGSKIDDIDYILEIDGEDESGIESDSEGKFIDDKISSESMADLNSDIDLDDNDMDRSKSKDTLGISKEEMSDLRDVYIAGNISGENIYDLEGRIIVKRNEEISKEIIRKAECSGKLSELILNMRLNNLSKNV